MADVIKKQMKELEEKTTVADDDILLIQETTDSNKKVTKANLLKELNQSKTDILNTIGTEAMGTTATDITGAIAEHTSKLNENANDIEILNKKDLRTDKHFTDSSIFSPALTSSHECWNKWVSVEGVDMENAPHTGALWGEVFTGGTSTRAFQIVNSVYVNTRKTYIRYMHDNAWSEFRNFATGYVKELELLNGWVKMTLTPTYSLAGNILTVNVRISGGITSQNTIIAETGLFASGGESSFFNCYTPTGQQLGTIAFTREGSILIVNEISSNADVCFNFSVSVN